MLLCTVCGEHNLEQVARTVSAPSPWEWAAWAAYAWVGLLWEEGWAWGACQGWEGRVRLLHARRRLWNTLWICRLRSFIRGLRSEWESPERCAVVVEQEVAVVMTAYLRCSVVDRYHISLDPQSRGLWWHSLTNVVFYTYCRKSSNHFCCCCECRALGDARYTKAQKDNGPSNVASFVTGGRGSHRWPQQQHKQQQQHPILVPPPPSSLWFTPCTFPEIGLAFTGVSFFVFVLRACINSHMLDSKEHMVYSK